MVILTVAAGLPGGNPARADDAPAGPRPPSPAELADPLRPLRLRLPVDVAASGEETARIAGARRRLAEIRERLARGSKQGCRSWAASRQRPIAPGNALVAANLAPWAGPYQTIRVFPSWVPDPETWLRVEEQLLVTASCVCPDGSPSPGGVPDGASIPGVPLAVTENIVNPAKLDLAWDPSCSIIATDYSIHEGTIGTWYSHTSLACSTGGTTAATITPSSGSRYYLVVPMVPTAEGSYGTSSAGVERPVSTQTCRAARIIAPCP